MKNSITNILLIILIIFVVILTVLQIGQYFKFEDKITEVTKFVYSNQPKDGYTPIKNKDYFDGKNGTTTVVHESISTSVELPGTPGKSAYEIWLGLGNHGTEVDFINSLKPSNGKDAYFELQCNIIKNRWEVRYQVGENWQVLNGEAVPCLGIL